MREKNLTRRNLERVSFVSDLHLFCDRSCADQSLDKIKQAASLSNHFVLGGDIFDMKWSRIGSRRETIQAAIAWLEDFIRPFADCRFYFLLGNHDCGADMVHELDRLTGTWPNFSWHDQHLLIEDTLFLHGDVIDCNPPSRLCLQANREKWGKEKPKASWQNSAYNLVVWARLHRLIARQINSTSRVARKLSAYIEDACETKLESLQHVVFGHTHWATQFEMNGVQFVNCGAAIHGLPFHIVEIVAGEINLEPI